MYIPISNEPYVGTLTFKVGLDNYYYGGKKRFEVYTYNDPLLVLTQFKPHFYDLLLTDIHMPNVNGFQLCEKIFELDLDIRVCFMSALEINIQALREVYPKVSFGCFIKKPVTIEYFIKRLSAELGCAPVCYVAMTMTAYYIMPFNIARLESKGLWHKKQHELRQLFLNLISLSGQSTRRFDTWNTAILPRFLPCYQCYYAE